MPRPSKARLAIEAHLQRLEAIIEAPGTPEYVRQRAISTVLRQRRMDERIASEKRAAAAKRKAAQPVVYPSVLPSNGREPVGWKPGAQPPTVPSFDSWPDLSGQGGS
jgi:hypothetical protein